MATSQGSDAPALRNPRVRATTGHRIAERRHEQVLEQLHQINVRLEGVTLALDRQQVIKQLHQINIRLEAVTVALDRQSKLTAETNAKLDGVMKYFVENWKLLRRRAGPGR
jgi:pyrimidine operon attenuation protein/uracil phosphoribosyltransferase